MRGIISAAGYVPYHRLRREAITEVMGGAPGRGTRSVASYDEDTTTLGVEAARLCLRSAPGAPSPSALVFATATPTYLDKTNATAIHAALRLDADVLATDAGGAVRSATGALLGALRGTEPTLVVAADVRTGLPNGADERDGGDAGAALLIGEGESVIAEHLGSASRTEEFLDRWRVPGDRSKSWEERFAETRYVPLAEEAYAAALKAADLGPDDVDRLIVAGMHGRAVKRVAGKLSGGRDVLVDDRTRAIGNPGTAQSGLLLADALESASPGQVIVLVHLADGADAVVLRTTDAIATATPARTVAAQVAAGDDSLPYAKFLSWRGMLEPEPPRRPTPARASAPAASRRSDWKFGFVGSRDRESGALHLPPARVSFAGGNVDDMDPAPVADALATIATFTVDKLAYSPSPPTVFAVLDFDGGGRLACELTDVDADAVAIGDRVEMTFRRLNEADGIANYFWKARPIREGTSADGAPAGGEA